MAAHDLQTPTFLLAMPQVEDPFFSRSVVLLMIHNDEGSLGLVVNRPTELQVLDVMADLEIPWDSRPEDAAFLGGPVQPEVGTVLFSYEGAVTPPHLEGSSDLLPGLSLTQHLADLNQLAESPPKDCRFLLGHAGWSPGQLMHEIERFDWLVAPVNLDLIFGPPEELWAKSLASIGVEPGRLLNQPQGKGSLPAN